MTKKILAGATALAFLAGIGAATAQTKPEDMKSGGETAKPAQATGGTASGSASPQSQNKQEDMKSGSETSPKKQKEGN